jgi:hypothetical protein
VLLTWQLTGRLQPLVFRRRRVVFRRTDGGPAEIPARIVVAVGGSVCDEISSPRFLDLPNAMVVLVLRKNGRKVEFRGWQLLCTKNTPRKLKLSVDSVSQTQLRIWNLALMPKWLRSQERKHSQYLKREHNFL